MTAKMRTDKDAASSQAEGTGGLRLDKWLWQARFFKTRSLAAAVASKGKVRINRMLVTKPHYKVRQGDVLTFAQGRDIRVVRILKLGERRGPAVEARTLYADIGETPASRTGPDQAASNGAKENEGATSNKPLDRTSRQTEPWGIRGGIDPKRARRQAIDVKMNSR